MRHRGDNRNPLHEYDDLGIGGESDRADRLARLREAIQSGDYGEEELLSRLLDGMKTRMAEDDPAS